LRFEWDDRKNASNRRKHRVSFETASLVFGDPEQVTIQDRVVEGEVRWQTIGRVGGVLLVVAHTVEDDEGEETVRIISARMARARDRGIYEGRL
jgi:uncharacterized DUF497 family protein